MTDFIAARWQDILFRSYQHTSLVIQSVAVALIIALVIAIFAAQRPRGAALANALSSIGLTLPSLALLGLAIPLLPLAWPIIMTGIRVATQMSMGVAAIAAYALGPGLGGYIYSGLSQIGGTNALNYTLVGTFGVVVIALIVDAILAGIQKLTTPKGISA